MSNTATFNDERPDPHDVFRADPRRAAGVEYRRAGRSGLLLPPISLGLWYGYGDDRAFQTQRDVIRYAFDHGVTHFDLANNYGPPPGATEENFGRVLRKDLRPYRNELVITTKAGWPMWPGPYGRLGSAKYLLTSLDESLERLGVDHVDIFYSHRYDPDTPLEETIGALHAAVRAGKARYVGISSYSAERTEEAIAVARRLGTPLTVHQPSYSLLNRWIEAKLLGTLEEAGLGAAVFTPLAQGLLTDRYLGGFDGVRRSGTRPTLPEAALTDATLAKLRALNAIAERRGQTLAQLALAWVLRDPRVTTAVVGATSVEQLRDNLSTLADLSFTEEELAQIDEHATEAGVNPWVASSEL
ncbi:L-glyceraldehyde 3-phosphate reductase [Streptomyces malaysiensis subsp. malaysiensis]|uniref:Aldo/keto reductase n=1 Tax=Streptomyces malaysiensis TaxID=92644 RepID=A0ABX6WHU4_STRMQ|nr:MULTISPECIES: aldo/keto reductase [Streptomyces]MCQ6244800.1 aldo/keto reductase [Streptomyces malaysiensis]MYU12019.1 aldo/keto reductase [Streptomyces sp. SID8361]MCD9587143.1 aldo/keto reductase [Streptomyces sp. 8ZJF_21]QPI61019.1 aldo/keto reductase [Streptomyces solisilvae]UHH22769.1 aldo/keto reductase [Streptomyces sp. HNM0561]